MVQLAITLSDPPPNLDFKGMPLFDVEFLRNGTKFRDSYNAVLIETYTCLLNGVILNYLE